MNNKILVIDDDYGINEVLEIILTENNYQTKIITETEKIIEKIEKFKPNLILLDIFMPDKNGHEICKQIKNNPKIEDTPVIILSASTQTKNLAIKAGADDFIFKPFEMDELLEKIKINIHGK